MIHTKKIYCEWVSLGTVVESKSLGRGCMISVIDRVEQPFGTKTMDFELGIYIDKSDDNTEYEVLVLKMNKSDKYLPRKIDNFSRNEDYGDCISFFFSTFEDALYFADEVLPLHTEFQDRPVSLI